MIDNEDRLVAASSLKEWEQNRKYLEVMQQLLYNDLNEVPPSFASKKSGRDEYMWQNLQYLMEKERLNTKFMFWAYNGHMSSNVERKPKGTGYYLKQKLRDKYYALGLECYDGTFQTRQLLPDSSWGDLKIDTLPVFPKSATWHFAQTGLPTFFVDLRQASSNPLVSKWLDTPNSFAAGFWVHRNANENFQTRKLKGVYDGVLFVQRSTPTHPSKNALARSKARLGF